MSFSKSLGETATSSRFSASFGRPSSDRMGSSRTPRFRKCTSARGIMREGAAGSLGLRPMDCVAFGQVSWRPALFLDPRTSRTSLFMIREMKSVVLVSDTPDVTAAFYRDVLGLPLEEEQHRGTLRHYARQLQSIHFAIHAREGFWLETSRSPEPATSIV